MSAEFESAKAFLQRKQGSTSVYDHLNEVILKMLAERPDDALAMFENLSIDTKRGSYPPAGSDVRAGGEAGAGESKDAALDAASATVSLFTASEPADGVAPEPVQDLMDEASYLAWGGASLGDDTYLAALALKKLSTQVPAKGLRLWGKILGTASDYLIAEGEMEDEEAGDEDAKDAYGNTIEKPGEGANKYTYWACSGPGGKWTKLPQVTPMQVTVARGIKRFFSGNLDAPVGGHPPFPGTEAAYLRAQIARISAETVLSPAGFFAPSEDESAPYAINPNEEEWEAPDLSQGDSWVHHVLPLNVLGRTTPNPPKVDAEGEEIDDPDAPAPPEVLKPIAEEVEEGGFAVRGCPLSAQGEDEAPGLVVVKSMKWPGAVTVGFGKRFSNIYIGYGQTSDSAPYAPPLPGDVSPEFDINAEDAELKEGADVTADPDEGKEAEDEEDED